VCSRFAGATTLATVKARTPLAALAALAAFAAASSPALGAGLRNAAQAPRVTLPSDATAATVEADPTTWIVGARARGGDAARIARAHDATRIAGGAWLAPRNRARALAGALRARGLLDYAEPNRISERTQVPDPLSPQARWRDFVVGDAVAPPVTETSPLIAVVDTQIDVAHPELAGSNITTLGGPPLTDFHGTATATVAAAPANGVGTLGIWPGARTLNVPLPNSEEITCAQSARGIASAIKAGAAAINMSYGSPARCTAEEHQIQRAVKAGAVPVAASGNEFNEGNPLEFPASLPHVVTVGAIGPDDKPTFFSNESAAVDLAAPGIGILTAVPAAFDPDKNGDGFAAVAGTSFSAPMVSAAVAWVRAARPELTPFQAGQVVRLGARDVGEPGYENATGFGALSLPGALSREPPGDDPLEPNDDIRYISGRVFRDLSPALYNGRRAEVVASADVAEDPIDVYRIKVRAGRKARLTLAPSVGDPDLFVFDGKARSVRKARSVKRSTRSGKRTDSVTVRNRGRKTTTFYAAVGFNTRKQLKLLNATYALRVR
jgi:subtilisin family serine protease